MAGSPPAGLEGGASSSSSGTASGFASMTRLRISARIASRARRKSSMGTSSGQCSRYQPSMPFTFQSTARIWSGPMERNSWASFGASASQAGRPCGPSSASMLTKTVPSPPTRLTISWMSRTDGRSEGSSSWKLDRISRPDASQMATAARAAAPVRVRNGRAMLNAVRRAMSRVPGRCTARQYHIAPAKWIPTGTPASSKLP